MERGSGRSRSAYAAGLAALLTAGLVGSGAPAPTSAVLAAAVPTSDVRLSDTTVPAKWADAIDVTREDSYYPDVGDPGIDMLHHELDLVWQTESRTLTGHDLITFRATRTGDDIRLDLGAGLAIAHVMIDGARTTAERDGKDLIVAAQVREDTVHVVDVRYTGTPEPVAAPTTRGDFDTLGFTITDDGEAWTMQEPYGAYTWLPVNDQPGDKAYYDVSIAADAPYVGVSNGTLTSRSTQTGVTRTSWHNADPMAAYLLTLGIGEYSVERTESASGVPIAYWTLPDQKGWLPRLRRLRAILDWVESKLGPYPFDSAGVLLNDSHSGMETQTLLSLGDFAYATSAPVLAHELVHQWYGDRVGPTDWRDIWMNEGMAMYLQAVFEDEHGGTPLDTQMAQWASYDGFLRQQSGPPGHYDPGRFGEGNVYYCPALMWHALRQRIGDEAFWSMVRGWPEEAGTTATRVEYLRWIEKETGEELTAFLDAWLSGDTTPD